MIRASCIFNYKVTIFHVFYYRFFTIGSSRWRWGASKTKYLLYLSSLRNIDDVLFLGNFVNWKREGPHHLIKREGPHHLIKREGPHHLIKREGPHHLIKREVPHHLIKREGPHHLIKREGATPSNNNFCWFSKTKFDTFWKNNNFKKTFVIFRHDVTRWPKQINKLPPPPPPCLLGTKD